jgi:hypothetical protein
MRLMTILRSVVFAVPLSASSGWADTPRPAPTPADPVVHENLAVYFLHGPSQAGPVPLSLAEALASGGVTVHETKRVNEIEIENTGREPVFVQAGDIVKGGAQDRVLTVSLLLPARSGRVPIGVFCVEQGRWSARGKEQVARFASADKAVPSREAKMAMFAPMAPRPAAGGTQARPVARDETSTRQAGVWESVASAQRKLSRNVGAPVASAESASSLQLALENQKLSDARDRFVAKLKPAGEASPEIVGFVIAINGKINSAEVYPSNALFRKMWPKMVEAAATEAIGEKDNPPAQPPSREDVARFLADAETGQAENSKVTAGLQASIRDTDKSVMVETRSAAGGLVHRGYLAKERAP